MKNLVRGGALLLLSSLFVVIIFAQAKTEAPSATANDSQAKTENRTSDTNIDKANKSLEKADTSAITESDKKLVKTTAMVSAKVAGASRGSFSASAYCFSGRTSMGHGVRRGLIAADPHVLPLGSKVFINAGPWSGTYLVSDTGGAIRGKKVDIWVPSCSEARKFGRRTVQIFAAQ